MRLYDDPLTEREHILSGLFAVLGGSGQIERHHLSKSRALRFVDRWAPVVCAFLAGVTLTYWLRG